MTRFLFVVPPMTGHVHPTLSVAHALRSRGHQTAWVGYGQAIGHLLPATTPPTLYSLDRDLPAAFLTDMAARARSVRGLAGLKFLWEEVLLPLGRDMLPGVEQAARSFAADVLVVDQQAFAGAFAARRLSLPWATLATTSADRPASLGDLPQVLAWTEQRLADLQRELDLEPQAEPENSPSRVIVFSTPALAGDTSSRPAHWSFVGPATGQRNARTTPVKDEDDSDRSMAMPADARADTAPHTSAHTPPHTSTHSPTSSTTDTPNDSTTPTPTDAPIDTRTDARTDSTAQPTTTTPDPERAFPWDRLSKGKRILASLGTLNAERGDRFFAALAEGLGGDPALQVIVVSPRDEVNGAPWPDNFIQRPWVPQLELLPHLDAVISHGGHNTVCEALSEGLPLVVAPIKDDQPVIAQQVVDAGCGLRLSFTRPRPALLAEAVRRVLDEPAFAEAAEVVRASFLAAGGAPEAARLLEELA